MSDTKPYTCFTCNTPTSPYEAYCAACIAKQLEEQGDERKAFEQFHAFADRCLKVSR